MAQNFDPVIITEKYVGPDRRNRKQTTASVSKSADQGWARIEMARAFHQSDTLISTVDRVLAFYDGQGTIETHRQELQRLVTLSQRRTIAANASHPSAPTQQNGQERAS